MNNFIIKDSGDPVDDKDVANKAYVSKYVKHRIIKATDTLHTLITNTSSSIEEKFKEHQTRIITFKDSIQTDIHLALSDCKKKVETEIIKLREESQAKHK